MRILGTSADSIDEAEDRERFDELLAKLDIPRPKGETVLTKEEAVAAAGDALESAFDFMERAFQNEQEMVVFVNELALGPDSAPFLSDNECERFEQYSQTLLLDATHDQLLAELERDDLRQSEHSRDF